MRFRLLIEVFVDPRTFSMLIELLYVPSIYYSILKLVLRNSFTIVLRDIRVKITSIRL